MESVSPYTTRAFHLLLASTIRMAFSKVSLADCTTQHSHVASTQRLFSQYRYSYEPIVASVHMSSMDSKILAPIDEYHESAQQSFVQQDLRGRQGSQLQLCHMWAIINIGQASMCMAGRTLQYRIRFIDRSNVWL